MTPALKLQSTPASHRPDWLTQAVRHYLDHTLAGISLRALAKEAGTAPSTIMRQVRRVENLRDDALADQGLKRLEMLWPCADGSVVDAQSAGLPNDATMERDRLRVLRALMKPASLLVVADGVEGAIVVQQSTEGKPVQRAVMERPVAEMLVLCEWIEGEKRGKIARYHISGSGRSEITRLIARNENRRAREDENKVIPLHGALPEARQPKRAPGAETPVQLLARRKFAGGGMYLTPELVKAALRFRENFEIANLDGTITQDWNALVQGRTNMSSAKTSVCWENGMEQIEKELAYPARSGKIILRIALQMLDRFYRDTARKEDDLIY